MDEHDKQSNDTSSRGVDSSNEEGAFETTARPTTPKTPAVDPQRLHDALARLEVQLHLTKEQLAILPVLGDVTLVPQHDSHVIVNTTGVPATHPFKLFIGQMEWKMEGKMRYDNAYVYLFKGRGKQMKMEVGSPDAEGRWAPFEATYFGSLKHLAYLFNEWIGAPRFIAAVKFYFMLAWESDLFTDDPSFEYNHSWANDLQGACDDLIGAKAERGLKAFCGSRSRDGEQGSYARLPYCKS